jgi:hypothetical protein
VQWAFPFPVPAKANLVPWMPTGIRPRHSAPPCIHFQSAPVGPSPAVCTSWPDSMTIFGVGNWPPTLAENWKWKIKKIIKFYKMWYNFKFIFWLNWDLEQLSVWTVDWRLKLATRLSLLIPGTYRTYN